MKKLGVVFSLLAFLVLPTISSAAIVGSGELGAQIMLGQTSAALAAMHLAIKNVGGMPVFDWDKTPWRVDQGGTGATSFTNGSLLFYSNGFAQDNANLFWSTTNHSLQIGTNASTSPIARLMVKGTSGQATLNLISSSGVSQMYVASNGNVGLGNTNPQHKLDVSGAMYSRLVAANSGSIDWNAGNVQSLALTAANTTMTFAGGQAGGEYTLILKQDGTGGRTVSWPTSIKWVAGGQTPTLTTAAKGVDIVHFVYDGTSYLGSVDIGSATVSSSPPTSPPTLTNGLISYWKLGGNSNDAFGTNNGTDSNILYGTVYGKINQGAAFDGVDSGIDTHLAMSVGQSYSVSEWMYLTVLPTSAESLFWSWDTSPKIFALQVTNSGLQMQTGYNPVVYPYTFFTGKWYLVTATSNWNGGNYVNNLYLNGVNVGSNSSGGVFGSGSLDSYIGYGVYEGTSGGYFQGYIDEVGVWNRALTPAEVSQLYNNGIGVQYPF